MSKLRQFVFCVLLASALGIIVFVAALPTRESKPQIIVYLDKDAKQPAMLPLLEATVVTGDRAALWWSVFNKVLEKGQHPSTARYIATDAVEAVYGKAK